TTALPAQNETAGDGRLPLGGRLACLDAHHGAISTALQSGGPTTIWPRVGRARRRRAAGARGSGRRSKRGGSALGVLFQEFDGVTDGQDGLGGIVGNLAAELFFEGHPQFDRVETVRTEVV